MQWRYVFGNWTHDFGIANTMFYQLSYTNKKTEHTLCMYWSPLSVVSVTWVQTKAQMTDSWIECNNSPWDQLWNAAITCEESRVMFMKLSTKLPPGLADDPNIPPQYLSWGTRWHLERLCMYEHIRVYVHMCVFAQRCTTWSSCWSPLFSGHRFCLKSPPREHRDMVHHRLLTDPNQLPWDTVVFVSEPAVVETLLAQVK